MFNLILQARRILSASLLLFFVVSCDSPQSIATATLSPTATEQSQPTSTQENLATTPPSRTEIETYTVQPGDTVTKIAAAFQLKPETVLWANYPLLLDSPDFLFPDMQLTILPTDGVYHQIGGTDTITSLANFFVADPQSIIDWPANQIDPNNPVIFAGQWLIVPGGIRAPRRRLMPNLPRFAMAVSFEEFGSGACPLNSVDDTESDGIYAWPVSEHRVVGEAYWSAHQAADLAATVGEEIRAADGGVVVFSGWSNFGYGNMVMLDHGNDDFTLYGGLAEATALCGHSVAEGETIGIAGETGHPVGPYLHFEIRHGEEFLDPLTVLPSSP